MAATAVRRQLRGQRARDYLRGSLAYCACHPHDVPLCAPRALEWYHRLLDVDLCLPLAAVLDLGHLLLLGDGFRFRGFFSDSRLAAAERAVRERYETRLLLRRLGEASFGRLHRLLLDSPDQDAALARALELLLRPAAAGMALGFSLAEGRAVALDLDGEPFDAAVARFEEELEHPGALLEQLAALADHGATLDLDRVLQAEDFYELAHVRVFPRQSLREVARRIKAVERLLGPTPPSTSRALRHAALAATRVESAGTYPIGGIAELTTRGPLENLLPSELVYLEPDESVDLFTVRYAENELLKFLRDGGVLHWLRRTVVFYVDECAEFMVPLTAAGPLKGTKVVRCLLGLVLAVAQDLVSAFEHDDLRFVVRLVSPPGAPAEAAAERREIAEVLHLLLREKEEQGTARVEAVSGELAADCAALPLDADRAVSVVAFARPEALAGLQELSLPGGGRPLGVAVGRELAPRPGAVTLPLGRDPVAALRAARARVLEQLFTR